VGGGLRRCDVRTLLLLTLWVVATGCAGQAQRDAVDAWFNAITEVDQRSDEGRPPLTAQELIARIGPPDYCVPAEELHTLNPDPGFVDGIVDGLLGVLVAEPGRSSALVAQRRKELLDCRFWFYDEAARYSFPVSPWAGMGVGWYTVCFALTDDDNVLGARDYASGRSRLLHPAPEHVWKGRDAASPCPGASSHDHPDDATKMPA
jgi:hypothetical protein